jgi:hypothetical protein
MFSRNNGWLLLDDPDVLLLHIGTNGPDQAGLTQFVTSSFFLKPDLKMVVAQIIPKTNNNEANTRPSFRRRCADNPRLHIDRPGPRFGQREFAVADSDRHPKVSAVPVCFGIPDVTHEHDGGRFCADDFQ